MPNSFSQLQQASFLNVKLELGRNVKLLVEIDVQLTIIEHNFKHTFLILPSSDSVVFGNTFFRQHSSEISPRKKNFKLPEVTNELNEAKTSNDGCKMIPKQRYPVVMSRIHNQTSASSNSTDKSRF